MIGNNPSTRNVIANCIEHEQKKSIDHNKKESVRLRQKRLSK